MCLGEIVVDSSFVIWGWNAGTPLTIPFTSYLNLGGDHPILVDAGARSVDDIQRDMGLVTTQTADQTLAAGLGRHGLTPGDVGTLILTHLHVDHTGLVDQLPNARVRVQRSELQYAAAPWFPPGFFDCTDVAKLVGPLHGQLDFDEDDAEVAPGVRVVLTGGHSPGHQMVYVDVDFGQVIITGDNVYRKDPALAMEFPPGLVHDLADTLRAMRRIARDGRHVLPMHDPVVYDEYPDGVR